MRLAIYIAIAALMPATNVLSAEQPLKVLFIGNSYTYVNDLPGLVAGMAESAGRKIETDQHTPGGCSLERHVKDGKAVEKIGRQTWDVVVLQDHSMMAVVDPALMHESARKLHEDIRKQGARTVFYLTWARQNKPEMQDGLNKAYFAIAKELGAAVAPVGIAWQRALKDDPKLVLHQKDGSHPNAEGSYLAACVFYATLLGKSPEGLPAEIRKGGKTLVKLDPTAAKRLQAVAWKTVQEMKSGTPH